MSLYRMRIFLLNKVLFIVSLALGVSSCISGKQKNIDIPKPYITHATNGLIYDATFQYKDFQASGLLVLKQIEKSTYHVVLLSKFGPSIMEFKMNEKGITWIKSMEKMDKKVVEKIIERDFRMILLTMLEDPKKVKEINRNKEHLYYKVKKSLKVKAKIDPEAQRVLYAENKSHLNIFKTKATFTYGDHEIPENITLDHSHLKVNINLNLLKINNAER
ncbi:MAG: hypothetical protein ACK4ND_10345 [Cytophagaceae bacterium]